MRTTSCFLQRTSLALALAVLLATSASASPALPISGFSADAAPHAGVATTDLLRSDAGSDALQPGEFEWQPGWDVPNGAPVIVMVNLRDQRAYVYRDGQFIGLSTVSSGSAGHETPIGVFEILEKQKVHHSNIYDNAPMPWMQRLTWTGLSLHGGVVRAYPASHGCVRLPAEFARQLYTLTKRGGSVVISDDGSVQALARAGVGTQLALLIGASTSPQQMADALSAGDGDEERGSASSVRVDTGGGERTALSP